MNIVKVDTLHTVYIVTLFIRNGTIHSENLKLIMFSLYVFHKIGDGT